jgi:hypothetical protein
MISWPQRFKAIRKAKIEHFSPENWVDFARGFAKQDQRAAMERHLKQGCHNCQETLQFWAGIVRFASQEPSFEPPKESLRAAKVWASVNRALKQPSFIERVAALVYDSFREPLPAGVRSSGRGARDLLYRQGSIVVAIRVESPSSDRRVSLTGQVQESSKEVRNIANVPVWLSQGKQQLISTLSNRHGEFQLEFDVADDLRLRLAAGEKRILVIPLNSLISTGKGASSC